MARREDEQREQVMKGNGLVRDVVKVWRPTAEGPGEQEALRLRVTEKVTKTRGPESWTPLERANRTVLER